jgi:hypothetical protein
LTVDVYTVCMCVCGCVCACACVGGGKRVKPVDIVMLVTFVACARSRPSRGARPAHLCTHERPFSLHSRSNRRCQTTSSCVLTKRHFSLHSRSNRRCLTTSSSRRKRPSDGAGTRGERMQKANRHRHQRERSAAVAMVMGDLTLTLIWTRSPLLLRCCDGHPHSLCTTQRHSEGGLCFARDARCSREKSAAACATSSTNTIEPSEKEASGAQYDGPPSPQQT